MYELVDFIVKNLVAEGGYEIMLEEDGNKTEIIVFVDKDKIAKLIGKGGKIAKAIRAVVGSASRNSDTRYTVTFKEREC